MSREREPLISFFLYHLFKWVVVSPAIHMAFRGRIYGAEKVPMKGPLVVVCNHASDFDAPMLSNCVRRPVAYMSKEELFTVPVLSTLVRWYGAYPVKRGKADRAAIRGAQQASENGWAVGLFLEGTRTADGLIHHPKLGASMIAKKLQAPILPVCLWGTHKILGRGQKRPRLFPLTVRIGDLIQPPDPRSDREALLALTNHCAQVINDLHHQGR
jgi:1-acyl-sn-glycerol-3-phosphate acyltransferase